MSELVTGYHCTLKSHIRNPAHFPHSDVDLRVFLRTLHPITINRSPSTARYLIVTHSVGRADGKALEYDAQRQLPVLLLYSYGIYIQTGKFGGVIWLSTSDILTGSIS